ncbi:hypothetical protein [Qipengyuania atrilutea]|uniref:Uncharacterized protein n=1 Tax=Qipengyuania atrilutea TaxID=2744473 RepID=A0A850H0N4_9SPHN|nr:hypothetical protein [Actirhodobacter atriluteus]NVD43503.1 hypothetical protein [Actirhodobacter atriluteus]
MLNQDQRDAIAFLNSHGWTDVRIGNVVGRTDKAICQYRKSNGIPAANYRHRIDDRKAISMYEMGETDGAIARVLGVDQSAICYWRKRNGLKANFTGNAPLPKHTKRMAKALLKDGASKTQVATAVGCSVYSVQKIRRGMTSPHLRRTGLSNKDIRHRVRKDTRLLEKIEAAVGAKVPQEIREHASYDMYADLFEGVLSVELIEERASRYRNKAYSMCGSTFEHARLDAANDQGLTLLDRLSDELTETTDYLDDADAHF